MRAVVLWERHERYALLPGTRGTVAKDQRRVAVRHLGQKLRFCMVIYTSWRISETVVVAFSELPVHEGVEEIEGVVVFVHELIVEQVHMTHWVI